MKNIVLNIPHSSINAIFDPLLGGWDNNPRFLNECVKKLTDWYTDYLFITHRPEVIPVVFPYSRFVCDAERLQNDDMEEIGQGIAYRYYDGHIRQMNKEREQAIHTLWKQNQQSLRNKINEDSVIIDCHSFSGKYSKCDICIGHNNDWSFDSDLINLVKNEFEQCGYTVSVNAPFANSITPNTDCPYKSLMIEVNKHVYMNEFTLTLKLKQQWFTLINRIYDKIIES